MALALACVIKAMFFIYFWARKNTMGWKTKKGFSEKNGYSQALAHKRKKVDPITFERVEMGQKYWFQRLNLIMPT